MQRTRELVAKTSKVANLVLLLGQLVTIAVLQD